MAGPAGDDLARNYKSSECQHVILRSRYRQSRAAHGYHLGCGPHFINGRAGIEAAAQLESVDCARTRRRSARAGHEFIHVANGRRQNCRRETFESSARTRGINKVTLAMNSPRTSHVRWLLVFWLFILSAVSYLDRANISIAGWRI